MTKKMAQNKDKTIRRGYVTHKSLQAALDASAEVRRKELEDFHGKLKETIASKGDLAEFAQMFLDEKGKPIFATKGDVEKLEIAVKPVIGFYDKLALSAQLVNGGGVWLSRTVLGLAALLVAFGLIKGYFVSLAAGFFSWVVSGGK